MAVATLNGAGNWSADDKWTISGIGTMGAADGVLSASIVTPTVPPNWTVDALVGRRLKLNGAWFDIIWNDETSCEIFGPPANATYTYLVGGSPLPVDTVVHGGAFALAMDVTPITVVSISAVGTSGTMTVPAGARVLNTNLLAGNVALLGLAAGKTVTGIGTATGGAAVVAYAVDLTGGSATVVNAYGGAGLAAYGLQNQGAGAAAVTGKALGGAGVAAHGCLLSHASGTVAIGTAEGSATRDGSAGFSISAGTATVALAKGGGVAGAPGVTPQGGIVTINGVDLTGVGQPVGGGVVKLARGVALRFSDAAGVNNTWIPVPRSVGPWPFSLTALGGLPANSASMGPYPVNVV